MKLITSRKYPNFKPNRHAAGMESAKNVIEFEVVRCKPQEDASHAEDVRYTPVGAGIRIDDPSGIREILITQIQSEQTVAPLYKGGLHPAWNPANPNGGQGFLRQTEQTAHVQ